MVSKRTTYKHGDNWGMVQMAELPTFFFYGYPMIPIIKPLRQTMMVPWFGVQNPVAAGC
jgi:hypothetical protein